MSTPPPWRAAVDPLGLRTDTGLSGRQVRLCTYMDRLERLELRLSAAEKAALRRQAEGMGTSVSEVVRRMCGLSAAVRSSEASGAVNGSEPLAGGVEPVQRADNASEGHSGARLPAPPVGLTAKQVAGRMRIPEAAAKRLLAAGRIEVRDGLLFFDGKVER